MNEEYNHMMKQRMDELYDISKLKGGINEEFKRKSQVYKPKSDKDWILENIKRTNRNVQTSTTK